MKILLLTGMLASGKSIALRMLQDLGYYCIDNLPASLIQDFLKIAENNEPRIEKIALVIDMRSGVFFKGIEETISCLRDQEKCEIIFFDASDEVLIQRYKLQRRKHLMSGNERIEETIIRERKLLEGLREIADYIIDTSTLVDNQLKERLAQIVSEDASVKMTVNIVSFGFKYGILKDADIVMDVRFLPNPYYIPELKAMSGLSAEVRDYVMGFDVSAQFVSRFVDMVRFLFPNYIDECKSQLIIGIGCSGGRHRSVAIAREIESRLQGDGIITRVEHRDIKKDDYGKD